MKIGKKQAAMTGHKIIVTMFLIVLAVFAASIVKDTVWERNDEVMETKCEKYNGAYLVAFFVGGVFNFRTFLLTGIA